MKALEGIRVLDLTHHISGPTCTMLLADYGADVFKIEPIGGEPLRAMNVVNTAGHRSTFFAVNRNKRSIAIDLKTSAGQQIVRQMAKSIDVLVQNFRPGVAERLNIGYESLSSESPQLIYCAITGFGSTGPCAGRPALDLVVQAMGGIMGVTGDAGGEPLPCGAPIADYLAGIHGALAILLALQARTRTGRGQNVEASMLTAMVSVLNLRLQQYWATGTDLTPLGSRHPQNVPWGHFDAADKPFVVAVSTQEFWRRFCKAIERDDLAHNPLYTNNVARCANRKLLDGELAQWFRGKPCAHWLSRLVEAGVPCGPVNSIANLANDEQVRATGILEWIDAGGAGPIPVVGPPVKLGATPGAIRTAPPAIAADTREVLKMFGYSDERIAEYAAAGVVQLGEARTTALAGNPAHL